MWGGEEVLVFVCLGCVCVCVWLGQKRREEHCCPSALLAWRKEDVEVGSGEKEKEVALQHSECEGDLGLVSSSRVSQFSNAELRSLSVRVIFTSSFCLKRKEILCKTMQCIHVCVCSGEEYCTFIFYTCTRVNDPPLCERSTLYFLISLCSISFLHRSLLVCVILTAQYQLKGSWLYKLTPEWTHFLFTRQEIGY